MQEMFVKNESKNDSLSGFNFLSIYIFSRSCSSSYIRSVREIIEIIASIGKGCER
jgi:hypothetical protein